MINTSGSDEKKDKNPVIASLTAFKGCNTEKINIIIKQEFLFFDFEQSAVFVFAEYTAMMGLWVFISFYAVKGIRKITSQSRRKE